MTPADEHEWRRRQRMATKAGILLADDDFKQIIAELKKRALAQWANTASGESEAREELYRDVQAVGRLEALLSELVQGRRFEDRKK
jgi:hypothetical protein